MSDFYRPRAANPTPPADTPDHSDYLEEAFAIVRGTTMRLATREHLLALAEECVRLERLIVQLRLAAEGGVQ